MENRWPLAGNRLLALFQPLDDVSQHRVRRVRTVAVKLLKLSFDVAVRMRRSGSRIEQLRIKSMECNQLRHEQLRQLSLRV